MKKLPLVLGEQKPEMLLMDSGKEARDESRNVLARFDSFCKRVVRNERRNYDRAEETRGKYEEMYFQYASKSYVVDKSPSDELLVQAGQHWAAVDTEQVQSALYTLPENQRKAIILCYWEGWDDSRIANYFELVPRTIRKWRKSSLNQIRCCLERGGIGDANKRNDQGGYEGESPGYRPGVETI